MTKTLIVKIDMEDYKKIEEIAHKENIKTNKVASVIIKEFLNPQVQISDTNTNQP